jgi:hypothetical protein
MVKNICFEDWISTDTCPCGGPVFKFHNVSKNTYVIKCGHIKEIFDVEPKTKKWIWVKSKKQPCKFNATFHGDKPIFEQIKKKTKITVFENPHKKLYDNLKSLFRFVLIDPKSSVLQEIDLLVKNKLFRLPRKIYYFPTAGPFMKESHREPLQEFHDRIFSREIIDKSYKSKLNIQNNVPESIDSESELEESDSEEELDESETEELIDSEEEPDTEAEAEEIVSDAEGSEVFDDYEEIEDPCDYDD